MNQSTTKYTNPWFSAGLNGSSQFFTTDKAPKEYRGMLIYRRLPESFEVVKNGVCLTQRAGYSGATSAIDLFLDDPAHWEARRMQDALDANV